jgi:hypothetical protein
MSRLPENLLYLGCPLQPYQAIKEMRAHFNCLAKHGLLK